MRTDLVGYKNRSRGLVMYEPEMEMFYKRGNHREMSHKKL